MSRPLKGIEDIGLLILTHKVDCKVIAASRSINNEANSFIFAINLKKKILLSALDVLGRRLLFVGLVA